MNAVCSSSDKRDKWGQMSQMSFRGDGDKPPQVYVPEVCLLSLCLFVFLEEIENESFAI
jgi:hypothetical protein